MKILIVGATGTLGQAVSQHLSAEHEIIRAGKSRGDFQVDMTDSRSIRALFAQVGKVDAIISTAGHVHFGALNNMTADQFKIGLHDKLLGQVDLALTGLHYLNDGGSITLTSGILSDEPILGGVNATAVNAAIEGFVRGAAIEMPRGTRINVVSPNVVQESMDVFGNLFRGFEAVPVARVAFAYQRSVEGAQTGRVYQVW